MSQVTQLEPQKNVVFILGAGFSRAISQHMPLTDELGRLVIAALSEEIQSALNAPEFRSDGISFESWLTWLAERQPYESESDFFSRFAHFLLLQREIANVVRQRQSLVEENHFPSWLFELIDFLHHSQATVITLNYDTLLESAFSQINVTDETGDRTQLSDLTKVFPRSIGMTFGGQFGPPRANGTLDLLKLHGSTNWYWVPKDVTGSTLEVIDSQIEGRSEAERKARRAAMAGKMEFIVPPTSSKNEYFENPKTRFLWEESYRALNSASSVVLLGYSLPLNDSTLASMLARSLTDTKATLCIVNPDAGSVETRLSALGINSKRITTFRGSNCIQDFVNSIRSHSAQWVIRQLMALDADRDGVSVAVGWGQGQVAAVIGSTFDSGSGVLTLAAGPLGNVSDLSLPGRWNLDGETIPSKTMEELKNTFDSLDKVREIKVELPEYGTWTVGGFVKKLPGLDLEPSGEDYKQWLVLRPLGHIPHP